MIYTFSFEYSSDANSRLIYELVRAGLGSCGAQLDGWLQGPSCGFFTIITMSINLIILSK